MSIKAIRGFNDITGIDAEKFFFIEKKAREVFSLYGFSEIKLPVLEKTELFTRSIGDTTDIVEKEMYTFLDRKEESLSLRPEGTASAVRAYIEHKLYNDRPLNKLFYMGPMFRYERPQKGRYRQFYQIGVEVFGESSPLMDAEIIEMAGRFFKAIGLEDISFEVNSLGCPKCRPTYRDELIKFLKTIKDDLCENCVRRMDENPLRALDCKVEGCKTATKDAPSIMDSLCDDCEPHFKEFYSAAENSNLPNLKINNRMVRGLDYYTKTAFEITTDKLGAQNTICAGGRYDSLVKELGGPHTNAFGFAMGIERIALLLDDKHFTVPKKIALLYMGDNAKPTILKLADDLRNVSIEAHVVYADYKDGSSFKSLMKRADKLGANYAVIIGDDELEKKEASVKDLSTAEQTTIAIDNLVNHLKGLM